MNVDGREGKNERKADGKKKNRKQYIYIYEKSVTQLTVILSAASLFF